jgi:hypothetical protein
MEAFLKWLDSIAGPQYASAVMWTIGALVLLVFVLLLIRVVRSVSSGTFVAGGRNRRARLAVMDAAAIDNQRRLVLVRRDNVEHLILIGGPTDVVVEQNIVPASARQTPPPSAASEPAGGPTLHPVPQEPTTAAEAPRAERLERPRPEPMLEPAIETPAPRSPEPEAGKPERQEPAFAPERKEPIAAVSPQRAGETEIAPAAPPEVRSGSVHFLERARIAPAPQEPLANQPTAPAAPEVRATEPAVAAVRLEPSLTPPRPEQPEPDLDSALQEELKAPLVEERRDPEPAEASLEEEMRRLLGELSTPARK